MKKIHFILILFFFTIGCDRRDKESGYQKLLGGELVDELVANPNVGNTVSSDSGYLGNFLFNQIKVQKPSFSSPPQPDIQFRNTRVESKSSISVDSDKAIINELVIKINFNYPGNPSRFEAVLPLDNLTLVRSSHPAVYSGYESPDTDFLAPVYASSLAARPITILNNNGKGMNEGNHHFVTRYVLSFSKNGHVLLHYGGSIPGAHGVASFTNHVVDIKGSKSH